MKNLLLVVSLSSLLFSFSSVFASNDGACTHTDRAWEDAADMVTPLPALRKFLHTSGDYQFFMVPMLPLYLLFDAVVLPFQLLGAPVVGGRFVFKKLQAELAKLDVSTPAHTTDEELAVLRKNLSTRFKQAEEIIGCRRISTNYLMPFTLSLTVFESFQKAPKEKVLVLSDGKKLSKSDASALDQSLAMAFSETLQAKNMISRLPLKYQSGAVFYQAILDRMTEGHKTSGDSKVDETLDFIIQKLSSASLSVARFAKN